MVVGLLVSSTGAASAAQQTLTIYGAVGTPGASDPYTDFSMDGGATWHAAYLSGSHPWGFVPGTNSWLNCDPNGQAAACLNRTVLYRIRFTIPDGSSNPQMVFDVKADNYAAISVNGTHVADIEGQGGTTADASIAGALHTGVNEIRLDVRDTGGWAGLNYKITLTMDAPAPLTLGVPTIATSGTAVSVKAGSAVAVDPGVSLKGFDTIDGATVTINNGFVSAEDQLAFTNQNGIVGTYNSATGVLTLSGSASSATYQAALQSVMFRNTNPNSTHMGPRTVTFSVGAGALYNAATGHFYKYVASSGISWTAARDAAALSSLYGLRGYLATITSQTENSFVTSKLAGRGWIGASDAAQEGVWQWVTGPEAGTVFSGQYKWGACNANTAPGINGQYANWAGGEPNDCGSTPPGNHAEDYAHFYVDGRWNDYPSSAGVDGYVVEYGGMAGDSQPVLSANATVNVVDGAPPVTSVSAAPTQQNGSVAVTLKATDNVPGTPVTSYQIDGGPAQTGTAPVVTGGGDHDLTYWSTDAAGNAETAHTVQISVDPTVVAPTVTAQNGANGFTGATAQLSGTAEPGSQVAVYLDADPAFSNLALRKPTSQSSWYNQGAFPGGAAVDGVVTGRFGAHTANGTAPWWQVDLGQAGSLDQLVIWNRIDCCGTRENTLSVLLSADGATWTTAYTRGGTPFGGLDPNGSGQLVQTLTDQSTPAGGLVGPLKLYLQGTPARYIRLQVQNPNLFPLNFDELQAFGTSASAVATVTADGSGQWSYTADNLSDGSHTVRVVAYGAAGSAHSAPLALKVDATAPTVTGAATPAPNAAGWNNSQVQVHFTCADEGGSGLASCTPDSVLNEGTNQSATGTATDNAGNTASAAVSGINIDLTAPTTTISAPATWQNQDVTMTLAAADNLSGVAKTYYTVDGGAQQSGTSISLSAEGTHTITYWSVDAAGNAEAAKTATVQIDKTVPTITGSAAPDPNSAGWYNVNVTVTFACGDALSGIAACSESQTLGEGANQSATGSAADKAGNTASATVSGINVDMTAPTISGAPDRAANNAGWYKADVTVSFTCHDQLSGVAECAPAQTLGEGADQSATGSAADKAGNTASATVSGINVDKTAPTISGAPDRAANEAGWYNADVTVSFTCDDALSGVANCAQPKTLGEGAGQSATGSVTDNAGNTASATVSGINVDTTAPTVTYTGNAGTYSVDQKVNITCTAADSLSGVAASTCANVTGSAYEFALGDNTYAASATDKAGNETTNSTTFTVTVDNASLCKLTRQFVKDKGLSNSLCVKLDNAAKQAAAGNAGASNEILQAYMNEVAAQTGKALTAAQADILTRLATALTK